ncbi:MAG: hypothetical protein DYG89_49410 [Caldilinea sp. CFX5]|nr:hypothetical protein [Caldilinea sp. CFX5]
MANTLFTRAAASAQITSSTQPIGAGDQREKRLISAASGATNVRHFILFLLLIIQKYIQNENAANLLILLQEAFCCLIVRLLSQLKIT